MGFEYKTVKGNALDYKFNPPGKVLIPQVCNDLGLMGSGVALGIKTKWPHVDKEYRDWYNYGEYIDFKGNEIHSYIRLGDVQFLEAEEDVYVANMIGQKDIGPNRFGQQPIRMDALKECIYRLREFVVDNDIKSVASPKFGSLRSGGYWPDIEKLILEIFTNVDVKWYTYEYTE